MDEAEEIKKLLAIGDPLERARRANELAEQMLKRYRTYSRLVAEERGNALYEAVQNGMTHTQIADLLGMTQPRVAQLIAKRRPTDI